MKDDLRPIPELTIRENGRSYFRFTEEGEVKVTCYHGHFKVLGVRIDTEAGRAVINSSNPEKVDILMVEKLLRSVLPEDILITEVLWPVIMGRQGQIEVSLKGSRE